MRTVIKIALISFLVLTVFVQSAFGFFIGFKPWKLPGEYTFTETHGTVIDAETKKPIEGLIVVGMWELEWTRGPTYISEAIITKLIHVEETVTDEKGQFTLPAPPSMKRPAFWGFNGEDPTILFFKPGYKIEFLSNYFWISGWVTREGTENYVYSKIRQSYWNGKVIDLEPFRIGRKIPIKDRYYTKERIMRYDTATQKMWERDLERVKGIFEQIEENDKKRRIKIQKVKNLLRVFAEERKKVSKPYYLDLPQRFEDYLKEMGYEK